MSPLTILDETRNSLTRFVAMIFQTEKALEDPNFTAAAVAEVEEEERQIQLALEATALEQLNPNPRRSSRKSLDISSGFHGRRASRRFSSVAGIFSRFR